MHNNSPQLPMPLSGLKSAMAVRMNDDGVIDEHIHLLSGCKSPYDSNLDSWWSEMEHPLEVGRANLELFYYQAYIVAFGGEDRGTFDKATGRCLDEHDIMNGLTFGIDRKLPPDRLTFPIRTTDTIEVLEVP